MANDRSAQTYAQAIFEQGVEGWQSSLKTIAASLEKSGLMQQLDNAAVKFPKKQELLRDALPSNTNRQVQNFVHLLASKNQVHLLPQIIAEFERYIQRGPLRQVARVTSAIALTASQKRSLEDKVRAKFGQDVDFEYAVDEELLGGVVVRVGDKVIDGSVAGKLAALKEKLSAR